MGPALGIIIGVSLLVVGLIVWAIVKAAGGAYQDYDPENEEGFKMYMGASPLVWLIILIALLIVTFSFTVAAYKGKDVGSGIVALAGAAGAIFSVHGLYISNAY
jgi:hypothetical protein